MDLNGSGEMENSNSYGLGLYQNLNYIQIVMYTLF